MFYQELIQLWSDVSKKEPVEAVEIYDEVLWNNKMIVSEGETLFNKYFIDKGGIIKLQDIINKHGEILSWSDVHKRYTLNNSYVINWIGLINCIPKLWRDKIINNVIVNDEDNINKRVISITSRTAYQILIKPLTRFHLGGAHNGPPNFVLIITLKRLHLFQ